MTVRAAGPATENEAWVKLNDGAEEDGIEESQIHEEVTREPDPIAPEQFVDSHFAVHAAATSGQLVIAAPLVVQLADLHVEAPNSPHQRLHYNTPVMSPASKLNKDDQETPLGAGPPRQISDEQGGNKDQSTNESEPEVELNPCEKFMQWLCGKKKKA